MSSASPGNQTTKLHMLSRTLKEGLLCKYAVYCIDGERGINCTNGGMTRRFSDTATEYREVLDISKVPRQIQQVIRYKDAVRDERRREVGREFLKCRTYVSQD